MGLDGGAMFGNVPKALWKKEHPADDANRIRLALRCLLVESDDRCLLIDTGMGDKWSESHQSMFAITPAQGGLVGALERLGKTPSDITDVVLTHLHFDHAGGATRLNAASELVPTFPQARHWVQQENLETARQPNIRERVSYQPDNFEPLFEKADVVLLDGPTEIMPGVSVELSHGHTRGLQMIWIGCEAEGGLLYAADLIPTASHVRLTYTMGYDIEPLTVIEEKKRALRRCVAEGYGVFLEHDPVHACVEVRAEGKRTEAGMEITI